MEIGDARALYISNARMKDIYGFEFQDPDTIDRLSKIKTLPLKVMNGTPWFHMMSNPYYVAAFNYIGPSVEDREWLIEDGKPDVWEEVG